MRKHDGTISAYSAHQTPLENVLDILVVGQTFAAQLSILSQVVMIFWIHNLKLKPQKCILFQEEVIFLGRIVSQDGVYINSKNVSKAIEWPLQPTLL